MKREHLVCTGYKDTGRHYQFLGNTKEIDVDTKKVSINQVVRQGPKNLISRHIRLILTVEETIILIEALEKQLEAMQQ